MLYLNCCIEPAVAIGGLFLHEHDLKDRTCHNHCVNVIALIRLQTENYN